MFIYQLLLAALHLVQSVLHHDVLFSQWTCHLHLVNAHHAQIICNLFSHASLPVSKIPTWGAR
jgi:hypothetical protein